MKRNIGMALLTLAVAGTASAQVSARIVTPRAYTFSTNESSNSARIGVMLGDNDMRDTLGVLVQSVVESGPAAKAGLKEGDRIQSIGTVNLKMARDDAADAALSGMMSRRLTRELDKIKAGDEVELRVLSGGAAKSVRVKTVAARELETTTTTRRLEASAMPAARGDRVALGLGLGGSISKRDTLGVFVMSVTTDGPAEKAGIVEGDRVARINTVDLRVPAADAGDAELSRARMRRFTQEVAKIKAGDVVTLAVVSGGRQREVRVTAVKASELHDGDGVGFFYGDGAFVMPRMQMPNIHMPNIEIPALKLRGGTIREEAMSEEIRARVERALEGARGAMENARKRIELNAERVRPIVRRSVIKS